MCFSFGNVLKIIVFYNFLRPKLRIGLKEVVGGLHSGLSASVLVPTFPYLSLLLHVFIVFPTCFLLHTFSRTFSDFLYLLYLSLPSPTFSDLLRPFQTFSDLLRLSRTFSNFLKLSQTFSNK